MSLIALQSVPSLGTRSVLKLLKKTGSAEKIFDLSDDEVTSILGKRFKRFEELRRASTLEVSEEEMKYLRKENIEPLTLGDKKYPSSLKNIYDPPPILFCKGTLFEGDDNAIAIVGARKCSAYGVKMAEEVAFKLASRGVTVVSGLARGIDTAAHRGAVKAGGRTIAVMGSGFRNIYPPENKDLLDKVADSGAVITEFTSKTPPNRENFPRRNRIVSGLAKGVVVIEAATRSGALITADFALDEGKDVFALPGRADQASCAGSNRLIQSGAKLVMSASDILDEYGLGLE